MCHIRKKWKKQVLNKQKIILCEYKLRNHLFYSFETKQSKSF